MEPTAPTVSSPPGNSGQQRPLAFNSSARPTAMLIGGAVITGPSSTYIAAAHVSACTAAAYRFLYALPVLGVLAIVETRRVGGRDLRQRALSLLAGAFLGGDLVLWARSITDLGAGIATVVSNLQVFPVSLLGWLILREAPGRRLLTAAPVAVAGTLLLTGLAGAGTGGSAAAAGLAYGIGSACCFAVFLVCQRMSQRGGQVVGPLLDATLGGAVTTSVLGLATRSLSVPAPARAEPYLIALALLSQTVGWLMITYALRHMHAARGALLLLINPIVAVAVSAAALDDRPSVLQLAGCVIVCVAVAVGSGVRIRGPAPQPPQAG
jgi:drug/metabolite transporter (DMT)-like permease